MAVNPKGVMFINSVDTTGKVKDHVYVTAIAPGAFPVERRPLDDQLVFLVSVSLDANCFQEFCWASMPRRYCRLAAACCGSSS